jgi:hypothetical protein
MNSLCLQSVVKFPLLQSENIFLGNYLKCEVVAIRFYVLRLRSEIKLLLITSNSSMLMPQCSKTEADILAQDTRPES